MDTKWILDTKYWILDTGYWILDTKYWILNIVLDTSMLAKTPNMIDGL